MIADETKLTHLIRFKTNEIVLLATENSPSILEEYEDIISLEKVICERPDAFRVTGVKCLRGYYIENKGFFDPFTGSFYDMGDIEIIDLEEDEFVIEVNPKVKEKKIGFQS